METKHEYEINSDITADGNGNSKANTSINDDVFQDVNLNNPNVFTVFSQSVQRVCQAMAAFFRPAYQINAAFFGEPIDSDPTDGKKGSQLVGLYALSLLGGTFYSVWRLFKDSAYSTAYQVGTGINDVFIGGYAITGGDQENAHCFNTMDERTFSAQFAGFPGLVLGFILRCTLYLFAVLGISRYSYHQFMFNLTKVSDLLFGAEEEIYRTTENYKNHKPLRYPHHYGIPLFLSCFHLGRVLNFIIYTIAGLIALTLGTRQSWDRVEAGIKNFEERLFGSVSIPARRKPATDYSSLTINDNDNEEEDVDVIEELPAGNNKKSLKFFTRFALLPSFYAAMAAVCLLVAKVIQIGLLLALGNSQTWQSLASTPRYMIELVRGISPNNNPFKLPWQANTLADIAGQMGILPRAVQGGILLLTMGIAFTVVTIAFVIQMLWKLTLGNFIGNACGCDGYFNRIYRQFFQPAIDILDDDEKIQRQLADLLHALPYNGRLPLGNLSPSLHDADELPLQIGVLNQKLTSYQEKNFFQQFYKGFLYDVRKAISFGVNTPVERVIIKFAEIFKQYVEAENFTNQQQTPEELLEGKVYKKFFSPIKPEEILAAVKQENPVEYGKYENQINDVLNYITTFFPQNNSVQNDENDEKELSENEFNDLQL